MDNITLDGRIYTVTTEQDEFMGAPWEEHDCHGVVSDWTTRAKRAGEWVLNSDWFSHRFYDFAATIARARSEGWGLSDEEREALAVRLSRAPTAGEVTAESVRRDFEYLRDWCNDRWCWVYVTVTGPDGALERVGGFESTDEAGIEDAAQELADSLHEAWQDARTEEATL